MANSVCEVLLTDLPLVSPRWSELTETGAIVDFWGVVREMENGIPLRGIEYEAHAVMAKHQLQTLAAEAVERFDLRQVWIAHRIAFVPVGEASLLVRIGSRHRAASFAAGEWLVKELKKRVPIWKHPQPAASGTEVRTPEPSPDASVPPAA